MSQIRSGIAASAALVLAALLCGCGGSGSGAGMLTPPPQAPVIGSFAATPADVTAGQSCTMLAWQVSGATSVQLTNVTATPQSTSASLLVAPAATTTYTLTATNSVGSTQQSTMVTVTAASQVAGVQVNPTATTGLIPANFLGIGQQIGDTTSMVGSSSSNMNPIYEQLLKNLT